MTPAASETLRRHVLLAVELIDPVSMAAVCRHVRLRAVGLTGAPLIGWSGRFVWLAENAVHLSGFAFDPGAEPYEADFFPAPAPLPVGAPAPLLRFTLRPSVAYPFSDGLTVVRGSLRATPDADAAAIAGAQIWISWTDHNSGAQPAPAQRLLARTGAHGDFAACLRLHADARPLLHDGRLAARIMVEHQGGTAYLAQDLPEGRLFDLPAALALSALTTA